MKRVCNVFLTLSKSVMSLLYCIITIQRISYINYLALFLFSKNNFQDVAYIVIFAQPFKEVHPIIDFAKSQAVQFYTP